jgi:GNAT superfamily N-acetyltransferase
MASTVPAHPQLRPLTRGEVDVAVDWAAAEGWNPGLRDAAAFRAADPDAFVGVERDGELIATAALTSYGGEFGFIGFFIVRPELRGQGIGRSLWSPLCDALRARLRPGAAIGLDGVFAMQGFYAETGFRFAHRNLRMGGVVEATGDSTGLRPLTDLPFADVAAYDRAHFGFDRGAFLREWIDPPGGRGLALVEDGALRGIGVARPCREGFKLGPLFADDDARAERLFGGLAGVASGTPIFLDVPELNPGALALADRHGLDEVFGCARMYLGQEPPLPWERIFGVTTFELG